MKRMLVFVAVCLTLTGLCSGQAGGVRARQPVLGELRVGVVLPETGLYAAWGKESRRGLELAINNENSRRSVKVRLFFADSKSTAEGTREAVREVLMNYVVVLAGPVTTANVRVLAEEVKKTPLSVICPTATGDRLLAENPNLYRVCFSNNYQGAAMALFVSEELGAETAGILYDSTDDYSTEIAEAFREAIEAAEGTILESIGSLREERDDYAEELQALKGAGVKVVALPVMAHQAVSILKQAHEMNVGITFIGGDGWENEGVLKTAGEAGVGHYFAAHFATDENSPPAVSFVERYRKRYPGSQRPSSDSALGYDLGLALADAASRAQVVEKPSDIAIAFGNIENLPGVTGFITVGEDRQVDKGVVILSTTDRGLKFVKRYRRTGVYIDEDLLEP